MLRELLRRLDMMVILENRLDALVRLHTPLPPAKIGGANDPLGGGSNLRPETHVRPQCRADRDAGAGGLCDDRVRPGVQAQRRRHALRAGARRRRRPTLPAPGLPFSLVFRAEPGREDVVLRIASAYEAASKRRIPPPAFGPVG